MICSSDASEDLDKRHDPSEKARELLNEGLHVFPVEPRGKKPLVNWAEYQHRPPTPEEFENWCERFPGCNWGIATGLRLIVIDADTGSSGWPQT